MDQRLKMATVFPEAYRKVYELDQTVVSSGIDYTLLELIKIRASQLNGCAYCLDMHIRDARTKGESEQRIYALSAWRETPFFTQKERAVLALTESVTLISSQPVTDELFGEVLSLFGEKETAKILMAIVTINAWNRIAVAIRMVPGQSPK